MKIMANANLEVDIVCSFMKGMEMIFKERKAVKEQSDVMQKVFGMLEKMTERIMNIEENNNKGKSA